MSRSHVDRVREHYQDGRIDEVYNPTATLYLALGLASFSMRKIGVMIAPLQPGNELEDVFNSVRPQG